MMAAERERGMPLPLWPTPTAAPLQAISLSRGVPAPKAAVLPLRGREHRAATLRLLGMVGSWGRRPPWKAHKLDIANRCAAAVSRWCFREGWVLPCGSNTVRVPELLGEVVGADNMQP